MTTDQDPDWAPATWLAGAHFDPDPQTGALVPPLSLATTFARGPDYQLPGPLYARDQNPTLPPVESLLARLEKAAEALLFSSGMAAATTVFEATLRPGDHLVVQDGIYWALRNWMKQFAARRDLDLTLVAAPSASAIAAALKPGKTKLVWIETPSNPLWDVIDIAALAPPVKAAGALLAVDSTAATPLLTRPLELGADLVFHAATKYLNGHSDVLSGVLATREQGTVWAAIRADRAARGAIPSALGAYLLGRGLRTLALRVARASASALDLAARLEKHPAVTAVRYPGLTSHPHHAIARVQMTGGFGGMLSIQVAGGAQAGLAVCRDVKIFRRATSFGGTESLIEHRASIEGPESPTPADLLRLSVGIEDVEDLWADLNIALTALVAGKKRG